jgi:hypothetical protein
MGLETFEEKTVELDKVVILSRKDGIIQVIFKEGIELDVDLQDRMLVVYLQLFGNTKRPFLFNAFNDVFITKEARDHSAELEKTYPGIASAVIADNLAYKIIANFYLKVNKPKTLYKVFNDVASAEIWLKTFL